MIGRSGAGVEGCWELWNRAVGSGEAPDRWAMCWRTRKVPPRSLLIHCVMRIITALARVVANLDGGKEVTGKEVCKCVQRARTTGNASGAKSSPIRSMQVHVNGFLPLHAHPSSSALLPAWIEGVTLSACSAAGLNRNPGTP
jgi:hypothetical protein